MCVEGGGGSSQELRISSVNTGGLRKSGMVSLLILGFRKSFPVPQFPCLQRKAMDLQPICLVEREVSANEKKEGSAFQALGWCGLCQPPRLESPQVSGGFSVGTS